MVLFPAFAALAPRRDGATVEDYRAWLIRVSQHEFADELVASCVARHLCVRIIIVPYTPPLAAARWCIAEYPSAEMRAALGIHDSTRLVLGNNDVHYVWVRPL